MKSWIKNHLILVWAFASILFAVAIHFLFHWEGPEWLVAKWSAGEILTYVSTVALGLLAVWQNQQLQKENEKSQQRIENISVRANEISMITCIAEYEKTVFDQVKKDLDTFISVDECAELVTYAIMTIDVVYRKDKVISICKRIQSNFERIIQQNYKENLFNPLIDLYVASVCLPGNLCEASKNNTLTNDTFCEMINDFTKEYTKALAAKQKYLNDKSKLIETILFDNLPLSEVRKICTMKENKSDGQTENAQS